MAPRAGIDLSGGVLRLAVGDAGDRPVAEREIPAAVGFALDGACIGEFALALACVHPPAVVTRIAALLDLAHDERELEHAPVTAFGPETDGQVSLELSSSDPADLLACLLSALMGFAPTGPRPAIATVIAAPCPSMGHRVEVIREAARRSGIPVDRIVPHTVPLGYGSGISLEGDVLSVHVDASCIQVSMLRGSG